MTTVEDSVGGKWRIQFDTGLVFRRIFCRIQGDNGGELNGMMVEGLEGDCELFKGRLRRIQRNDGRGFCELRVEDSRGDSGGFKWSMVKNLMERWWRKRWGDGEGFKGRLWSFKGRLWRIQWDNGSEFNGTMVENSRGAL